MCSPPKSRLQLVEDLNAARAEIETARLAVEDANAQADRARADADQAQESQLAAESEAWDAMTASENAAEALRKAEDEAAESLRKFAEQTKLQMESAVAERAEVEAALAEGMGGIFSFLIGMNHETKDPSGHGRSAIMDCKWSRTSSPSG